MSYGGTDFERIVAIPGDDPQAAGRNVSTESATFELPTSFQMSIGMPLVQGANPFTLYGAFNSNSFGNDNGRIGAELMLRKTLALRAGYTYDSDSAALFQYTYGAGLRVPFGASKLNIDWAAEPVNGGYFDDVQHFSVGMNF